MDIFELQGVFAQPWLNRKKEAMTRVLETSPSRGLLFNLREVERIDPAGAEAILETVRRREKRGILGENLSVSFVAEQIEANEPIPIFQKEREAVEYFGKEFALLEKPFSHERRSFPRIKTALPVALELKDPTGGSLFFEAVVLNLSEGGLCGRFLDSRTEELADRTLDPFDLKLLEIQLSLGRNELLKMQGKVLRQEKESSESAGQIALEFYNLPFEDKEKIREFLRREGGE